MKKILIYGSKEFADIVTQLAKDCGREVVGYIDDFSKDPRIIGDYSFISQNYNRDYYEIALGIGYSNLQARLNILKKLKTDNFTLATLIHPQAYVANSASIGEGSIIMARTIVDLNCFLNLGVVCWPGSTVNHDSTIGANTFISPGAVICGFSNIGQSNFIGANATIIDSAITKENTFIKANSIYKVREI